MNIYLAMAIWSCLMNLGLVFDFSPVFLSTRQIRAWIVTFIDIDQSAFHDELSNRKPDSTVNTEHWLGQTFQNRWFCKVSNNLFSHCLKVKHAGVARADNRLQVQHHNLKRRVGKMSFSQVLEKNVSQVLFYSLEHQKPFQSWSGWRGSRAQSQGSHHSPRSPLPEKPGFNSWKMR